jgi:hypothetical protein
MPYHHKSKTIKKRQEDKHLSLLYITKNKTPNTSWVKKCPIIDEIIMGDEKKYPLANNFAQKRNKLLQEAKNEWGLFLDTDEIPSDQLIEFLNHFDTNQYKNFAIKRIDYFFNKPLLFGDTGNFYITRLILKNTGKFIHPIHEIWQSNLPTQKIKQPIYHYPHPSIKQFLNKINQYSEIRSQDLAQQKHKTNLIKIIFYPIAKFIHLYFFKLGLLDGIHGLIFALFMSYYSFLVRAKLWHISLQ